MNRMRYSDVCIATMQYMNHMDFSSWALRINHDAAFDAHTREEAAQAYRCTAQYISPFLDSCLKGDAAALDFINRKPEQNQLPSRTPSLQNCPVAASGRSSGSTTHWVRRMPLSVSTRSRSTTGVRNCRAPAAHIHPDKIAFLYDDLGEAYEATGNTEQAIANCRRALAIDPNRPHGKNQARCTPRGRHGCQRMKFAASIRPASP